MTYFVNRMYNSLKRKGLARQFERAGIYCICIDDVIVYIGKSVNILYRMAEHYCDMKYQKSHKYIILSEAKRRGHKIRFNVLYSAQRADYKALEEEIGEREGYYIRLYRPPLNTQIPKEENWRQFTINPDASTVTLDEIMEGFRF